MPTRPPVFAPPWHRPYRERRIEVERRRLPPSARGYGRSWRRRRDDYLRRFPWCADCAISGRRVAATDVDHVIAKAKGGADDESNWIGRCHSHHSQKTAAKDGGFGNPVR